MNLTKALKVSKQYLDKLYPSEQIKLLPQGIETTNFWWINYDAPDNKGEFAAHIILNKSTEEIIITTCPPKDVGNGFRFIQDEEFKEAEKAI